MATKKKKKKERRRSVEDWEKLLDQAEAAFADERHQDALQLCDRAAQLGEEARYHAAVLRGDLLLDLGDAAAALSTYESVADPEVVDSDIDCARGVALFELGRFAEARNALESSLRGDPKLAEAHYTLGLIAEILGTGEEAACFRRARTLDPKHYTLPPSLSEDAFRGVIEEALGALPAAVREAVRDIPILIADLPRLDDLTQSEPPLSPRTLGLFFGVPPAERSVLDAPAAEQPTIMLFKRNLERACPDRDTLTEEIRETVIHEVGHALGLDEGGLHQLGID